MLGYEQYFYTIGIVPPVITRFVFALSGLFLFREYFTTKVFTHPFVLFALSYFFFCLFWFAVGGFQSYALDTFKGSMYLVLYGIMLVVIFPHMQTHRKIYTWLGITALLAGVYSIYSDDGSLLEKAADSMEGGPARKAGNYLNANAAAYAVTWMLAFLMVRLRRYSIIPFLLIAVIGIIITLSRSGFLMLGIIIISYLLRGYLPRLLFVGIFVGLFILSSSGVLFDLILSLFDGLQADSLDRLSFFFFKNVGESVQGDDRYELVEFALQTFYNSPFFGNGMGFTTIWNTGAGQGTHNMMLMHLVEFGITGIWIIPAYVIALWKSGSHVDWQNKLVWCIMIFLGSFFSHNYFDSMSSVFIVSMLFFIETPFQDNIVTVDEAI